MSENEPAPVAVIDRQPRRMSTLWIAPVIALAFVGGLLYMQVRAERGPIVSITFDDASGLEVGANLIHRGIRVGVVKDVRLDKDLSSVLVEAEIAPHAEGLAAEGTQFWIVRPEVSLDRVSGLDT
ncbi:MAG: MCE family protein, partial [Phycisphaerales bacterium]|nr:MCE family protein [Phycisphaerales bacterium]